MLKLSHRHRHECQVSVLAKNWLKHTYMYEQVLSQMVSNLHCNSALSFPSPSQCVDNKQHHLHRNTIHYVYSLHGMQFTDIATSTDSVFINF